MKLARPSLGSWLTFLNCAAWVLLLLIGRSLGSAAVLLAPFALILSLPFAWIMFFNWSLGFGPVVDLVMFCTVIGLNSLVWGHGLAAIAKSEAKANSESPSDVTPVDSSAPRIVPPADGGNPYTPPSGG